MLKNLLHEVPKTVNPPPICLCFKREDAGGVDHLLLLEQVHAVWAKKPETSAGVPIKCCKFINLPITLLLIYSSPAASPEHRHVGEDGEVLQLQFLHTSVDRS